MLERIHTLSDRLYEIDRVVLEYPQLQRLLYLQSDRRDPYFVQETEHDNTYFQLKSFVYTQINLCDEIFCVVDGNKRLEKAFEFQEWKEYIIRKLRHPFFREVIAREGSIWGEKFRYFLEINRARLLEPVDKEMY
jgi:hypothetical protein